MMDFLLSAPGMAAVVTLILAGAIQGSTGFGFNMLAAPALAVIDPAFVPGPMIFMATVVSAGGMVAEWRDVHRRDLGFALTGRAIAALAAAAVLGVMSREAFAGVFGLGVLLAVVLSLAGLKIQPTGPNLLAAGAISGFMGTLTSIGAPPMAMVYQNTGGARMRATLNSFFVVGGLISLAALGWAGIFTRAELLLGLAMLPFAFAGFLLSGWGKRLVDKGRIKPVVLAVSSISSLVLLARAFG